MALPTRSAASLTDFLTSYSENYLNTTPLNQAWENTPLLDYLLKDARDADGGNELVLPVMDGYPPAGDSYGVGSTLNLTHVNHATQARYSFAQVYEPAVIDDVLFDKASGSGAKLRYVEGQLDRARMAIRETVCAQLCAASTGTSADGSFSIPVSSCRPFSASHPPIHSYISHRRRPWPLQYCPRQSGDGGRAQRRLPC